MYRYKYLGLTLESDCLLEALPSSESAVSVLRVINRPGNAGMAEIANGTVATGDGPVISPVTGVNDTGRRIHEMSFPGLADFYIETDQILYFRAPDCPDSVFEHLLLDNVLPGWGSLNGRLLLHASAVAIESGAAIAFAGRPGYGKSTLSAALVQRGAQLLSDECIELCPDSSGPRVIPSYAGLRLNPDSVDALDMKVDTWQRVDRKLVNYSKADPAAHAVGEARLKNLYVLTSPAGVTDMTRRVLSGPAAITAIMESCFILDHKSRPTMDRLMHLATEIASQCHDIFTLDYPRDYKLLPGVVDRLLCEEAS